VQRLTHFHQPMKSLVVEEPFPCRYQPSTNIREEMASITALGSVETREDYQNRKAKSQSRDDREMSLA
jgi:hypothetical protein